MISAPGVSSPGAEGAQDGISTKTLIGCTAASSCISRTPASPSTFATSCGSVNIVVVPCGITARANWLTMSIPNSTCMCPSQSPGIRNRPPASITRVSGPIIAEASGPQLAKRPALIAMSLPGMTSREWTLTQAQSRMTRSAGARRAATAIRSAATSCQAGSLFCCDMPQLRPAPPLHQAIFLRQPQGCTTTSAEAAAPPAAA